MNPLSHRPGPRKARGASLGCDTGIDKMNPVVQAGGARRESRGAPLATGGQSEELDMRRAIEAAAPDAIEMTVARVNVAKMYS